MKSSINLEMGVCGTVGDGGAGRGGRRQQRWVMLLAPESIGCLEVQSSINLELRVCVRKGHRGE